MERVCTAETKTQHNTTQHRNQNKHKITYLFFNLINYEWKYFYLFNRQEDVYEHLWLCTRFVPHIPYVYELGIGNLQ